MSTEKIRTHAFVFRFVLVIVSVNIFILSNVCLEPIPVIEEEETKAMSDPSVRSHGKRRHRAPADFDANFSVDVISI